MDVESPPFRLLLDAVPIAIVGVDADGRIALVNAQAERLFGYDAAAMLGEPVELLVPERLRGDHPHWRAGYASQPSARTMGSGRDLYARRKDGSEFPVEIGLNPFQRPDRTLVLATIIDITERKALEALRLQNALEQQRLAEAQAVNAQLLALEERFELFLDQFPGIAFIKERGQYTLVNQTFRELFAPREELWKGRNDHELWPPDLAEKLIRQDEQVLSSGRSIRSLDARSHADGTHHWLTQRFPIAQADGPPLLGGIAIDITERILIEENLAAARDQAESASRLKSQFVATMSHELRTPLTAIIGTTELLASDELDERRRALVATITESADALLAVISSILDFSKIEAGKIEVTEEEIRLDAIVEGAADVVTPQVRKKRLRIHTYVDPAIPPVVRGDGDRLRQVLLNLIGNAVKFTEQGMIVVRALAVDASAQRTVVRFEVQDTGVGISDEVQARLFEPFAQGDASSARRFGGTGLGLSISKRLVELMGGEIGLSSEPGGGALFWFTVPFRTAPSALPARRVAGAMALVVSADDVLAEVLIRYLASWGIASRRVARAADVATATAVDAPTPWIALLDVDDPVDGIGIATLAVAEGIEDLRVITLGVDERLRKPVRQSHLFDRIVAELGSIEGEQKPPAASDGAPLAGKRRVLVAEDNASLRELIGNQLERLGIEARIVENGAQAVQAAGEERFDLVLMDCQMPELDGYEATRAIRRHEARTGDHVPIVAMTANAFTEDRDACLAAGMDDYLAKPLRIEALRRAIERWQIGAHGLVDREKDMIRSDDGEET